LATVPEAQQQQFELSDPLLRKLEKQLQQQQAELEYSAAEKLEIQRMAAEHQMQLQQLEAETVRQQQLYQEQVLQLETALLAQSTARERELQAQLKDLDNQFEEVEAADTRNKLRAAEIAELMSARAFEAEHRRLMCASNSSMSGSPSQLLIAASSSSSLPLTRSASRGDSKLQLPQGLPRVYEAAVSIVLQHGWQVLHGGDNAGPAWTALHWAASEGRLDVCDLLLRANADAGHRDELGKTALDYAYENGQHAAAAILQSAAEEASHTVLSNSWSPSSHQATLEASPSAQLVAALAAQGTWPRDEQRV
jgi:hypothetical protein